MARYFPLPPLVESVHPICYFTLHGSRQAPGKPMQPRQNTTRYTLDKTLLKKVYIITKMVFEYTRTNS
jgi:hypothetical protein